MKVLWLASWYPNKYEPNNGDFIQRHAMAVSELLSIDVIHVVQSGKDIATEDFTELNEHENLREFIYGFRFKKSGISFIDKIRYNLQYLRYYSKVLDEYISTYGKPDLIHVHVPVKAGLIARKAMQRWNIPYIVSEQASYYERSAPDNFFTRSYFFRSSAKKIFRDAAAVTNVSATIGKTIKELFKLDKVVTVHNLVDTSLFHYNNFSSPGEFVWLHVSALNSQKNIEGMIKAFALLDQSIKKWKLIVVGQYKSEHTALVKTYALESRTRLVGEVRHPDVATYMQQANAFVLFSDHENFPCVVVEALCSGLPVVASDVGGVKEAINASNGILVHPRNSEQLAKALLQVMENYYQYDPINIQTNAAKLYDSKVIAAQFLRLYRSVLKYDS